MLEKRQKGRSMIEMLGVLAIIAVLAGGVYGVANMAMARMKTNQVIDLVQTLIYDLRTANMVRGHYYGNTEEGFSGQNADLRKYLIEKKIVPVSLCAKDCATSGYALTHPLGEKLDFSVPKSDSVPGQTMSIILEGLNRKSCTYIVSSDWSTGGGTSNTIQEMKVNTDNTYNEYPVNAKDAASACAAGGSNNRIEFILRPMKLSQVSS